MTVRPTFGVVLAVALAFAGAAEAADNALPTPRFVSLKSSRVNVRLGPGDDYAVSWIYTKPGLPVEIVQEFDTWRRIRDSDGAVGWVAQALLSGRRTALVAPWDKKAPPLPVHAKPSKDAAISAYLQPGVLTGIANCRDGWCKLDDKRFSGWMEEDRLWGVYPGEAVD